MSREEIMKKVESLPLAPLAFQALWDGDSFDVFVDISAVLNDGSVFYLGSITYKDGKKVFGDRGPIWGNAIIVQELGNELAERYGVEFYFPSPHHPEDYCPAWHNRHKGYPCRKCGILLLQGPDHPRRGTCYSCHIDEENKKERIQREKEQQEREAQWTAEERAGPRCHFCGNPAKHEWNGYPVCELHVDAYELLTCQRCNEIKTLPKSTKQPWFCHYCEIQNELDTLTHEQKDSINKALDEGRMMGFMKIREILECDINHALSVIDWFIIQREKE